MINLVLWLLVGAAIGWLASIVMRTDERQSGLLNIVVGILGAAVGGFLFGANTINSGAFSLSALIVSFAGALILLAAVNLLRLGRIR
ncbi:transglycosylase [Kouleothrix aurantiaca]|jgi:uncharacterized membrane protein YeaQ/YmgE (transglycosylase-associated protein family)|uniref:Transglycosylase n=1 Tax=Kouleothrix aurantiaca TaxID=186479 RepID=A0A0P9H4G1_9CHLR|nr:transglycosylase [Kouleothrix aurantiaca]